VRPPSRVTAAGSLAYRVAVSMSSASLIRAAAGQNPAASRTAGVRSRRRPFAWWGRSGGTASILARLHVDAVKPIVEVLTAVRQDLNLARAGHRSASTSPCTASSGAGPVLSRACAAHGLTAAPPPSPGRPHQPRTLSSRRPGCHRHQRTPVRSVTAPEAAALLDGLSRIAGPAISLSQRQPVPRPTRSASTPRWSGAASGRRRVIVPSGPSRAAAFRPGPARGKVINQTEPDGVRPPHRRDLRSDRPTRTAECVRVMPASRPSSVDAGPARPAVRRRREGNCECSAPVTAKIRPAPAISSRRLRPRPAPLAPTSSPPCASGSSRRHASCAPHLARHRRPCRRARNAAAGVAHAAEAVLPGLAARDAPHRPHPSSQSHCHAHRPRADLIVRCVPPPATAVGASTSSCMEHAKP